MPPFYVSFEDKIIELKIKQKNEIVATIFKIGFRSVEPENALCYTCKKNIKIISARSVFEELTGVTIPCLLIQQASQFYLFALNSDLTKFVPLRKVNGLESADCETLILDGPAIVCVTRKLVSIHYSDDTAMCILKKQHYKLPGTDEKVCSCMKNDVHSRSNQTKSSVSVSSLHVSYIHNKYLLFLKYAKMCSCSQTKSGLFVLEWSSVNGFILLSNKEFVPEEYHSSLTCLHYYQQKKLHESMHKIVQTVILGTDDGFVIMIENGHLLNCVSLCSESLIPLPRPIDKICFSVNKICNSKDTVLVTQDDRVFGLNRELQIIRSWTGITKIFHCGYTDSGLLQFLLVRGDSLQDDWILTDLESQDTTFEQPAHVLGGDDKAKSESSDSLGSAVDALQKRLQVTRTTLKSRMSLKFSQIQPWTAELAALDRLKQSFTYLRTIQNILMTCWLSGRQMFFQPDLLPLIEGLSQASKTASNQQISSGEEPDIEIGDIWQRTYSDKWLVAVSFINRSSSNIQASISLVPSQHHGNQDRLTCHSSQVVSKGRHQLSKKAHPHRTHAKYPRTEFSANGSSSKDSDQVQGYSEPDVAVCRTELPKFGVLDSYSVAVFVTWTRNDTSKSENSANAVRDTSENHNDNGDSGDRNVEGNSPTNTEHVFSRHCGEVTLRVEDVISGKYVINVFTDSDPYDVEMQDLKDMKRDAAALEMIQQTSLLEIRSTPSILTSLDQWLKDRCQFSLNQRLSCHVTRVPTLSRVQLQLGPYTNGDKRTVKVYTSCDRELFLLVHHLYASLPDHVIILHRSPSSSDIAQSCLPSLQRELSFLEHGVRKLLDDLDHDQRESTEASEGNGEDIRKVGEKFKRQKERLVEKMKREVNEDKLKDLYEQLMRLAKETDLNIVKALP